MKRAVMVCACACFLSVSSALLAVPSGSVPQSQNQAEGKDDPSTGSKDVDQVVTHPMAQVIRAAKAALATYGCDVKKEKPDYLECTRARRIAWPAGSGGEKVTIQLTSNGSDTRVEIKTGMGVVGRAGKKNFSTPIFDEMMKTLKAS